MNKKICAILFFLALSPFLTFSQQTPPFGVCDTNPFAFEMRNAAKLMQVQGKGVGDNYDLKYHRFNWYIDPDTCYISGSVTSYFVTKQASVSHLQFELSYLLTVDSIKYAGANVPFTHIADVLDINLGTNLPLGHLDSVCVFYKGNPDAGLGFGSFIKTDHLGTPVIWTLSEPYGAKDWWPCKNILCDKIDSIDVIVTTPSAYRVASNGVLVSETTAGPNKIFHWRHRFPIAAYLIAIAVTNYSVYSDFVPLGTDTLEMLNYVYPENLADFQAGTSAQIEVLQLFDSLFGDYPYMGEKYGHAQFGWGGGMEHQTMSFVINAGFDLLAHEMAHQWYGDKITCASWHDIWVNESFGTYCQGITLNFMFNGQWWPVWLRDRINDVTSLPDGSVYCYDTTQVSRVFDWRLSYQKGAMVLHMLRWKIGDDLFFQGMKNIASDPLLEYSYATTTDIQHHFEAVSGLNLTEFFNDWIYREGHPIYTVLATLMPDSSAQVIIQQSQSHTSVSYFELPVPIRFKGAGGDTIVVFDNVYSGQNYTANLGFMPDSVFFDPEMHLLAQVDNIIVTFGIAEYHENNVEISPNPVDQFVDVSCYTGILGDIEISDLDGRICMIVKANGIKTIRIDVSALTKGIYLVKLISPYNIITGKFVKK